MIVISYYFDTNFVTIVTNHRSVRTSRPSKDLTRIDTVSTMLHFLFCCENS